MKHGRTRVLLALVLACTWSLLGCAQAPLDYPRTASWALSNPESTRMGRELGPQRAAHPARSGFYILPNGPDALGARLALIDATERTLDAQCFTLADDLAGNLFLDRLLKAGERGVRVRLLIDDWYLAGQDRRLAGVDAHLNVEVRVFNPVGGNRGWPLTRPLHYLFGPRRVLKRMHNKAIIADNTVAIVGGRNIADGYFTASGDHNVSDIDMLAAGPVVGEVSVAFDAFWNDRLAVPIEAFVSRSHTAEYARQTRNTLNARRVAALASPYAGSLSGSDSAPTLDIGQLPLIWAEGEALYDRPSKVLTSMAKDPSAYMIFKLEEILFAARREALVISPYFVPGRSGVEFLRQMRERGVVVKILTNSLASTGEIATHAGYAKYRRGLLRCGVELYELRPEPNRSGKDRRDHEGNSAGAGLHAKCLLVDRNVVFVGSFNLDPRSVRMDTQNGIVVRNEELAGQLAAVFAKRTSADYAYRVGFRDARKNDGALVWTNHTDGKAVRYLDEPMTGRHRRLKVWFLSWLVPEAWL